MSACRSGCPTPGAHRTWGECARAARVSVAAGESSPAFIASANWDRENEAYAAARSQGIQPASTRMSDIQQAVSVSEQVGSAFDATTGSFKE